MFRAGLIFSVQSADGSYLLELLLRLSRELLRRELCPLPQFGVPRDHTVAVDRWVSSIFFCPSAVAFPKGDDGMTWLKPACIWVGRSVIKKNDSVSDRM